MDARLQRRVQRYGWDAAAAFYHDAWQDQLRPAHDQLLRRADVRPGEHVLETACGSGLVTLRLAEAVGPKGRILATDLSQGMIDDLRTRLNAQQHDTITLSRMAAETLDVADNHVDHAVSALGLMYTTDPDTAVAEMARTTRPGGRVTATVWGERKNCGWAEVFPIVDARVASEVCPMFFGTGAKGALTRLFDAAGLADITETRQAETLAFPSEEDVIEAVLLGGPVALAVKRFDEATWAEVTDEFLSSVADYRTGDGAYLIPGEFVTVSGLRPKT